MLPSTYICARTCLRKDAVDFLGSVLAVLPEQAEQPQHLHLEKTERARQGRPRQRGFIERENGLEVVEKDWRLSRKPQHIAQETLCMVHTSSVDAYSKQHVVLMLKGVARLTPGELSAP